MPITLLEQWGTSDFLSKKELKNEWSTTSQSVDYIVSKQASKQLAIRIFEEN